MTENNTLWIEVGSDTDVTASTEGPDREAVYAVMQYAAELEAQGISPEEISRLVGVRLAEVAPHLVIESNTVSPFHVSIPRGIGWGDIIYFDTQGSGRDGVSVQIDDYDDESWV